MECPEVCWIPPHCWSSRQTFPKTCSQKVRSGQTALSGKHNSWQKLNWSFSKWFKIKFLVDILPLCSVFLFTIQYLQICLHGHVRKILSILFNIITTVQIYGNYFFYFKFPSIFNSSDQNLVASIIDKPIFYLIFLYSVKASLQVFLLIFLLIILLSKILSIRDFFKWANFKPFQTGGPWRFPWCPFRVSPLPVWNRWSSPGT